MIRRPPRSTPLYSSAASDVYKRQLSLYLYARDRLLPGIGLTAPRAGVAPAAGASESVGTPAEKDSTGNTLVHAIGGAVVLGGLALFGARSSLTLSNLLGVLMAASAGAAASVAFFGTRGTDRKRITALLIVAIFAAIFLSLIH